MKEHPLIMQPESVLAIRSDLKTQTRRVVTWHNSVSGVIHPKVHLVDWSRAWADRGSDIWQYLHVPFTHPDDGWEKDPADDTSGRVRCRWEVGDRFWVKESCLIHPEDRATKCRECVWYLADGDPSNSWDGVKVTPSLFMPRWACREVLEVTALKVQRLQVIRWSDAIAEGIRDPRRADTRLDHVIGCVAKFRELWDSINAKKHPWESNPWVWVPSFRRVKE